MTRFVVTPEDRRKMLELRRQGITIGNIAIRLRLHKDTVKRILSEMRKEQAA